MGRQYASSPLVEQGRTDLTVPIEGMLADLLRRGIKISSPSGVRQYLLRYPDMIDLLSPLAQAAVEKFGLSAQLFLDVYQDPEAEDRYLTLYVRQAQYTDDILDRIESVSAPFDEALATKSGWLLITTDFYPPK